MATPNYDINYNDERFQKVESDKNAALTEHEKTYDGMINSSDKYYQQQIDASKDWADKQSQLQQEQTDFAIEKIEQDKAQAKKDYTKEQSGAYVDWQKQTDPHGVNAEQMAASGLSNTGYSESSQVSMYNTYQNRVVAARESYNLAVQNYNNSITEARLQNNAALAEIAYNALQQQLELSLQGFQYKNKLLLEKANKKLEIEKYYSDEYQRVLDQINTENALAEKVRQYNESLAEEKRQYDETHKLQQAQLALQEKQLNATINKTRSSSTPYKSKTKQTKATGKKESSSKTGIKANKTIQQVDGAGRNTEYVLDKQSVLNLGGPYNGDTVANKVAKGEATATIKDGTIYVKKKGKPMLYSKFDF